MKELILENPPRSRGRRRSGKRRTFSQILRARKSGKTTTMTESKRRKSSRRRSTYLVRGRVSRIKLNPFDGSVFNKQNFMIAGGAVAGTVVSNLALGAMAGRFGSMNPYGRAAFNVLIPVVGAMVVKRMSPDIAKGLIIGGLANGIGQLVTASGLLPAGTTAPVQTATAKATAKAGAITAGAPATTGEYLGEYLGGPMETGFANASAFSNAW